MSDKLFTKAEWDKTIKKLEKKFKLEKASKGPAKYLLVNKSFFSSCALYPEEVEGGKYAARFAGGSKVYLLGIVILTTFFIGLSITSFPSALSVTSLLPIAFGAYALLVHYNTDNLKKKVLGEMGA